MAVGHIASPTSPLTLWLPVAMCFWRVPQASGYWAVVEIRTSPSAATLHPRSSSSESASAGGGGGGSIWTVKEVRPASGSTAGGTRILVLGWGFTGATSVTVGGVTAPEFKFINDATIEIVTPPGALGWQELRVWVPNGSVPAAFQYVNADAAAAPAAAAAAEAATAATIAPFAGKPAKKISSAPSVAAKAGSGRVGQGEGPAEECAGLGPRQGRRQVGRARQGARQQDRSGDTAVVPGAARRVRTRSRSPARAATSRS